MKEKMNERMNEKINYSNYFSRSGELKDELRALTSERETFRQEVFILFVVSFILGQKCSFLSVLHLNSGK